MVQVQQLATGYRYGLGILNQCAKMIETECQKVWGLIPTFFEVTGEKQVGGIFEHLPSPQTYILNRVKMKTLTVLVIIIIRICTFNVKQQLESLLVIM